jgi:transposase
MKSSDAPLPGLALTAWGFRFAGQSWRGVASERLSVRLQGGRSTGGGDGLSEQRKYRSWSAQQKLGIVLAGLRGDRGVREVCREHAISETLFYGWREKLLGGGREALTGKEQRQGERELRRKVAELERALGRTTYELEIAGKLLREWN